MVSDHKTDPGVGTVTQTRISIPEMRAAVTGRVITPVDPDYDAARVVFYGGIDRHPAVIVRVTNATDVAWVVAYARATGAELAVRSGGHSIPGHSMSEGGIVIDLSSMKALDIDPAGRTAWAEAGLTTGEFTTAAAAHGLAVGFGDTASVGIGGITLGGGAGYLVRKYGLTIDHLLAAEIVTADGDILHVDDHTHPDLFWAIRGGGGNFGVVTRFQFQLQPADQVVGGMLVLPASPEILTAFAAAAEAAPEELSSIINVMPAPPMPFLPSEIVGKLIILATLVYVGDVVAGQAAIAPFRALATPLVDMIRPMSYPEIYPPEDANYHPTAASRTLFIDRFDPSTADLIFDRLRHPVAAFSVAQVRILGGAYARVPADATAYAHRARRIMVNVAALYEEPELSAPADAWVSTFATVLQQNDGSAAAYVNFLGEDGAARIREAYPGATWDRLRAIKAHYDPTNLFRLNQNIPPAETTN